MLFVILTILSCLAAHGIGSSLEVNYLWSFLIDLGLHLVFISFSILFCVSLSLWLGESNQTHLKKILSNKIIDETETLYILENGVYIWKDSIDHIIYDVDTEPYIEIKFYNVGGWRAVLLFELYNDRCEYILHSYA